MSWDIILTSPDGIRSFWYGDVISIDGNVLDWPIKVDAERGADITLVTQ